MKLNPTILRQARGDAMEHLVPDLQYAATFRKFLNGTIVPKAYLHTPYGFREFLNEYGVGRTLKAGDTEKLKILKVIKNHAFSHSHVDTILALAIQLQKKKLSAQSVSGTHGLPRSFASKLMYIYVPDEIIPFDSYVLKSLEWRTGSSLKDLYQYYAAVDEFRQHFFPESGNEVSGLLHETDEPTLSGITALQFNPSSLFSWKLTDKYLWCEHNVRRK